MTKIYNTPYGAVHIPVESQMITVRTSGGFDSALLLYMIAQTCAELNPNAIIQPITVVRANPDDDRTWLYRVDNRPIVDTIIDWVRKEIPVADIRDKQWLDAINWWENGSATYLAAQKNLVVQNLNPIRKAEMANGQVSRVHDYNGVTKNPPVPMAIDNMHQYRELKRDHNDPTSPAVAIDSCTVVHNANGDDCRYVEPFRNADKRVTMWLADNLGILDTLDKITRSCEGDGNKTDNWTKTCDTCWWCQERAWAHREIINN
jgi:hypothetical protein